MFLGLPELAGYGNYGTASFTDHLRVISGFAFCLSKIDRCRDGRNAVRVSPNACVSVLTIHSSPSLPT